MQVLIAKIGAEYASRVQLDVLQHFRTAVACWQATEAEGQNSTVFKYSSTQATLAYKVTDSHSQSN